MNWYISSSKGQSAIEYLTTYGWMLLVIAIVGGAIFTTVQGQTQVRSTSGLANADVQVEDFGVTSSGLQAELRAAAPNQVENVNVSLVDPETGETVYSSNEYTIPVADTQTVTFPDVGNSQTSDTYEVVISYDSGGLEGLAVEGSLTGSLKINGTIPEEIGTEEDLMVESKHSTDSDFLNAQVASNFSVSDEELVLSSYELIEGANDGNLDGWKFNQDVGESATSVSSPAFKGSHAVKIHHETGQSALVSTEGRESYPDLGDTFTTRIRTTSDDWNNDAIWRIGYFVQANTTRVPEGYFVEVDARDENQVRLTVRKSSGGSYNTLEAQSADLSKFEGDEWLQVEITPKADGSHEAHLADPEGQNLMTISAQDSTYTDGGIFVGGGGNNVFDVYFDFLHTGSATEGAKYVSDVHDVDNAQRAQLNITSLSNVDVDYTIRTTSNEVLNESTIGSEGVSLISLESTTKDSLEAVLDVNITGLSPQFKLNSESVIG